MIMMQADISTLLDKRVSEAAELMDLRSPKWAEKVETARLDMSSSKNDVLAQVFEAEGGFAAFVSELRKVYGDSDFLGENPSVDWLQRHGFMADPFLVHKGESEDDDYTLEEQYLDLDRAWAREIRRRQDG